MEEDQMDTECHPQPMTVATSETTETDSQRATRESQQLGDRPSSPELAKTEVGSAASTCNDRRHGGDVGGGCNDDHDDNDNDDDNDEHDDDDRDEIAASSNGGRQANHRFLRQSDDADLDSQEFGSFDGPPPSIKSQQSVFACEVNNEREFVSSKPAAEDRRDTSDLDRAEHVGAAEAPDAVSSSSPLPPVGRAEATRSCSTASVLASAHSQAAPQALDPEHKSHSVDGGALAECSARAEPEHSHVPLETGSSEIGAHESEARHQPSPPPSPPSSAAVAHASTSQPPVRRRPFVLSVVNTPFSQPSAAITAEVSDVPPTPATLLSPSPASGSEPDNTPITRAEPNYYPQRAHSQAPSVLPLATVTQHKAPGAAHHHTQPAPLSSKLATAIATTQSSSFDHRHALFAASHSPSLSDREPEADEHHDGDDGDDEYDADAAGERAEAMELAAGEHTASMVSQGGGFLVEPEDAPSPDSNMGGTEADLPSESQPALQRTDHHHHHHHHEHDEAMQQDDQDLTSQNGADLHRSVEYDDDGGAVDAEYVAHEVELYEEDQERLDDDDHDEDHDEDEDDFQQARYYDDAEIYASQTSLAFEMMQSLQDYSPSQSSQQEEDVAA